MLEGRVRQQGMCPRISRWVNRVSPDNGDKSHSLCASFKRSLRRSTSDARGARSVSSSKCPALRLVRRVRDDIGLRLFTTNGHQSEATGATGEWPGVAGTYFLPTRRTISLGERACDAQMVMKA